MSEDTTLRAAIEALAAAWESKASRPPRGQVTESVQAAFHACAVNLRAALAASPAPTDTPDERPCICGPDSTGEAPDERPDCPVHRADVRCTCGHMRDHSHDVDGECWHALCRCDSFRPAGLGICTYDAAPHAMFDDCADWRPAAVTAPREDEPDEAVAALLRFRTALLGRPSAAAILADLDDVLAEVARRLAAAAPAVERTDDEVCASTYGGHRCTLPAHHNAHRSTSTLTNTGRIAWTDDVEDDHEVERVTPDPDTLAALLDDAFVYVDVGTGPFSLIDTTATARALIAAGVTLNETAT